MASLKIGANSPDLWLDTSTMGLKIQGIPLNFYNAGNNRLSPTGCFEPHATEDARFVAGRWWLLLRISIGHVL
jgi:hypothetical protein